MIEDLSRIVDRVAASVLDSPDAALALNDLAAADQYTHRHSVNVTALGLLLARAQFRRHGWVDYRGERRYDRMDQRLSTLGLGLLLHDIGKMAVPADVLNKPGPLDAAEWQLMRTHPEAGVALLGTSTLGPLVTRSSATTTSAWTAAAIRAARWATRSTRSRGSRPSPTSTTRSRARAPTRRPRRPGSACR